MSDIRTVVRSTYDLQKMRIQMGNRLCAQFRSKLGQQPSQSEDELDEPSKEIIEALRESYQRITDGVVFDKRWLKTKFKGDGIIDTPTELVLVAQYIEIDAAEKKQFKRFDSLLEGYPVYTEFLEKVKGLGPAMAGVIVSEIDIHKAHYPSSLWQYAGLDVKQDGRGTSRRSEHLIDREYTAKDGTVKSKKSITFNPFLKTKLMGVLGTSLIKQKDGKYRNIYLGYKHRLESHPKWVDATKMHRHKAATRYMVKQFLIDLYKAWRPLEGLPVHAPYHEAKLGMVHHMSEADRRFGQPHYGHDYRGGDEARD